MEAVVSVRGLSKRYRLGTTSMPYGRLTESISDGIRHLVSRRDRTARKQAPNYVWALRDVSFDVGEGEVVGVIGRNGAGKTTLLKVLSRITEPTKGEARVTGRVGALLEVGAGFHYELTGRENVFLNGAILGMHRAETQARFDEIVAFAEVEPFIDTPVKRYSSGMLVRLAFAVAAHLEPEVLIVDEVLAVGDAAFQKKCLGRMGEVATSGRTVLFVSHNMGAVRSLCQRALVLESGGVVFDGSAADAVSAYMAAVGKLEGGGEIAWSPEDPSRPRSEEVALNGIRLVAPSGQSRSVFDTDTPIRVEIDYQIMRPLRGTRFVLARVYAGRGAGLPNHRPQRQAGKRRPRMVSKLGDHSPSLPQSKELRHRRELRHSGAPYHPPSNGVPKHHRSGGAISRLGFSSAVAGGSVPRNRLERGATDFPRRCSTGWWWPKFRHQAVELGHATR